MARKGQALKKQLPFISIEGLRSIAKGRFQGFDKSEIERKLAMTELKRRKKFKLRKLRVI